MHIYDIFCFRWNSNVQARRWIFFAMNHVSCVVYNFVHITHHHRFSENSFKGLNGVRDEAMQKIYRNGIYCIHIMQNDGPRPGQRLKDSDTFTDPKNTWQETCWEIYYIAKAAEVVAAREKSPLISNQFQHTSVKICMRSGHVKSGENSVWVISFIFFCVSGPKDVSNNWLRCYYWRIKWTEIRY